MVHAPPQKKLPIPMGDLCPHLRSGSLGPPESSYQPGCQSGQLFLYSSPYSLLRVYFTKGWDMSRCLPKLPLPLRDTGPHLILASLGPPESTTQTVSQSVQLFLKSSLIPVSNRQTQTDRQIDHATSIATGHIFTLHACNAD